MNYKYCCMLFVGMVVFAFNLSSCGDGALDQIPTNDESEFAKSFIELIRIGDVDKIRPLVNPEISSKISLEILESAKQVFKSQNVKSISLMGYNITVINGDWTGRYSFEYELVDGWVVANAVLKKSIANYSVVGFNVAPQAASLKTINSFNLSKKSGIHFIVLGLTIVLPIFCLVSFVACLKTPIRKRKWLWAIFVVVGFTSVNFNWTTGQLFFGLLNIQLLSSSFIRASQYAPYIFTISIPIGAIIFWVRRKKL